MTINNYERIAVPSYLLQAPGTASEHYILRVGEDISQGNILYGDLIVVRRTKNTKSGDIILCTVDDEVLIQRLFYAQNGYIRLESINNSEEYIIFHPEEVRIIGIVTGLMRKL